MNTIRKRIRFLRKENNQTQEEFGNQFNISKQSVSHYETGIREPDLQLLRNICIYFQVSMDWLNGLSNVRNPYLPEGKIVDCKSEINLDPKDIENLNLFREFLLFRKKKK